MLRFISRCTGGSECCDITINNVICYSTRKVNAFNPFWILFDKLGNEIDTFESLLDIETFLKNREGLKIMIKFIARHCSQPYYNKGIPKFTGRIKYTHLKNRVDVSFEIEWKVLDYAIDPTMWQAFLACWFNRPNMRPYIKSTRFLGESCFFEHIEPIEVIVHCN